MLNALLFEDLAEESTAFREALERGGATVVHYIGGMEGEEGKIIGMIQPRGRKPVDLSSVDLVLLDEDMRAPSDSGMKLVGLIRSAAPSHCLIVATSSKPIENSVMVERGADEGIPKMEVVSAIPRLLEKARRRRQQSTSE